MERGGRASEGANRAPAQDGLTCPGASELPATPSVPQILGDP